MDMMDQMLPKMFEDIKEQVISEMLDDENEFHAVIGRKITKILKDEGIEFKKIEKSKFS